MSTDATLRKRADQLAHDAWIGDAVLSLYAGTRILRRRALRRRKVHTDDFESIPERGGRTDESGGRDWTGVSAGQSSSRLCMD
jgi:hypothetical protein